jgi:hypothetical protein
MTKSDERREEIRQRLMCQPDVADTAMHYAAHGQVDTEDLWWLYDENRIMTDGSAWLWAMMWEKPRRRRSSRSDFQSGVALVRRGSDIPRTMSLCS